MRRFTTILGVLAALALVGCGGDVDETFTGTLESGDDLVPEDNSFVDTYTFDTKEGYQIQIDMTSNDFDTYLLLQDPNGTTIQQNDDAAAGNTNSSISVVAPVSGTYTVSANSKTSGMTGAYSVHVVASKPGG